MYSSTIRRGKVVWAVLGCVVATSPAMAQGPFRIDPIHSGIMFRIKHMNVGYIYGRFDEVSGTFNLEKGGSERSGLDVQIKTESIDTNNAKRDQHLKGPDFFDAREYPTIHFRGNQVREAGQNTFEVQGELTLHGVTNPLTVRVEEVGSGKDPMSKGQRAGLECTFTIKRSDYGMKFMPGPIGDEVRVHAALEGVR